MTEAKGGRSREKAPSYHAWDDRSCGGGGPEIPEEKREEGGRARFREKSPQAHMVGLKHPYAVLKEKILSVSTLSVTCSFRFGDAMYCLVPFILHANQNP